MQRPTPSQALALAAIALLMIFGQFPRDMEHSGPSWTLAHTCMLIPSSANPIAYLPQREHMWNGETLRCHHKEESRSLARWVRLTTCRISSGCYCYHTFFSWPEATSIRHACLDEHNAIGVRHSTKRICNMLRYVSAFPKTLHMLVFCDIYVTTLPANVVNTTPLCTHPANLVYANHVRPAFLTHHSDTDNAQYELFTCYNAHAAVYFEAALCLSEWLLSCHVLDALHIIHTLRTLDLLNFARLPALFFHPRKRSLNLHPFVQPGKYRPEYTSTDCESTAKLQRQQTCLSST